MHKSSITFAMILGRVCAGLVLLWSMMAAAYETDQYTVPPAPLADVGADLSLYIVRALQKAVTQIEREQKSLPLEIQKLQAQMKSAPVATAQNQPREKGSPFNVRSPKTRAEFARDILELTERLTNLTTEEGFIQIFRSQFAGRITWEENRDAVFGMNLGILPFSEGKKHGQEILFDAGKTGNVYALAGFHRIISPTYFVFSSTMQAYGVYFGVDKIGHFFNQGFEYDDIYRDAIRNRQSETSAVNAAIASGVKAENGIFGRVVDGVYSNADLAANFAGFYFYQNLFREISINSESLPPMLERNAAGNFVLSPHTKNKAQMLLAPYISQHFNEAFTPSVLERPMRAVVRGEIKDRCGSFLAFHGHPSKASLQTVRESLQTWQGQNYGYDLKNTLNLDELCFK